MKVHIIYAHPNPESFNHSILNQAQKSLSENGIPCTTSDLYAMGFDPVLSLSDKPDKIKKETNSVIAEEQEKVTNADFIIAIYPIWWTQMPAILKGYIDRVFARYFAYDVDENGFPIKLLKGRKGLVISTFAHPQNYYEKEGFIQAFEQTVDKGIFDYVGIEVLKHFHFGSVPFVGDSGRKNYLKEMENWIKREIKQDDAKFD